MNHARAIFEYVMHGVVVPEVEVMFVRCPTYREFPRPSVECCRFAGEHRFSGIFGRDY